jgi:hypothetical protein
MINNMDKNIIFEIKQEPFDIMHNWMFEKHNFISNYKSLKN